jgi:hypothetical protein
MVPFDTCAELFALPISIALGENLRPASESASNSHFFMAPTTDGTQ